MLPKKQPSFNLNNSGGVQIFLKPETFSSLSIKDCLFKNELAIQDSLY